MNFLFMLSHYFCFYHFHVSYNINENLLAPTNHRVKNQEQLLLLATIQDSYLCSYAQLKKRQNMKTMKQYHAMNDYGNNV